LRKRRFLCFDLTPRWKMWKRIEDLEVRLATCLCERNEADGRLIEREHEVLALTQAKAMNEFTEITVKCVWTTIKGRIWRAQYRLRSKAVRIQSKAIYRALKNENKPRIYRVEIR